MGEQDIGDLEAIRKNIEVWLQRAMPGKPGLAIEDLGFPESSGESSVTLILQAGWPDGDAERFVLRMVPPRSQVFESHDLLMQVQMMEIMHAEGLPAPGLVGYEPDVSLVGSDFYVMRFTDGRIPPDKPPMAFGSWVMDLSAQERATLWSNGLETLAAIHGIDIAKHDLSRLPRADPGEPLAAHELRKFDSMYTPRLRETGHPDVLPAWEYLMANAPRSGELRLCWGDSRVGNVIWRDLEPVAVIDWEMANLADPLSDLTWWMWIDKCNSEGLGTDRMPGLPDLQECYVRWRDLTGLSIDHVAWFELFAVVRYAIILELKFQAMRAEHPEVGETPNFAAQYIPELLAKARAG